MRDIRDEMHSDRRKSGHAGLGLQYFIVGLCQKVLVANTVAPLADHAFTLETQQAERWNGVAGAWAYTLQIYFDFCGYSNMPWDWPSCSASASPRTSDYPYVAQSITEFWRRWHMRPVVLVS